MYVYLFIKEKEVCLGIQAFVAGSGWREEREGGNNIILFQLRIIFIKLKSNIAYNPLN